MNADEYQKLAMRTAINGSVDWINVGLGLAGEAGEVADHIKRRLFKATALTFHTLKRNLGTFSGMLRLDASAAALPFQISCRAILKSKNIDTHMDLARRRAKGETMENFRKDVG